MIHEDLRNQLQCPVNSIVAYSKGFACCGGAGTVHLFEKTDDKEFYYKSRLVKVSALCMKCFKTFMSLTQINLL